MSAVPPVSADRYILCFVDVSPRARAAVERAGGQAQRDRRRRLWHVTMPPGANWYPGTIAMLPGGPQPVDEDPEDARVRTTVYFWRRARGLCVLWSDGQGGLRHWRDGLPARPPCPCEGEADDPGPHRAGCVYRNPAAGRLPF